METSFGPKQYVGAGAQLGGYPVQPPPTNVPSRPSRLDIVSEQNMRNVESLVGLIDKLRAVRNRFVGDHAEKPTEAGVRALKSGHVGKLEDQAEGIGHGLSQAHEIVATLLDL